MKRVLRYAQCWLVLLLSLPLQAHRIQPGDVIIKLQPSAVLSARAVARGPQAAALNQVLRAAGAQFARSLGPGSDTYRVQVADAAALLARVANHAPVPGLVYAERNHMRTAAWHADDSMLDLQWNLRTIRATDAWDITTGGATTIAVLDTGVSFSHPDLARNLLPGYDFVNGDADASDDDGHGTHAAGIIAAASNNATGVAGVCWSCRVLPVKVLSSQGQGDDATIAQGIRWAVDGGARVISMSLGGPDDTAVLRDAVQYAADHDVLIVAAAGNGQHDGNAPNYPAAYPSVLAVTATNTADAVTSFSTTGPFVDIAAPGVSVWSTLWTTQLQNTYGSASGTSTAAPHVAGAAALVLAVRPALHAQQLAELLEASADDIDAPGKDPESGYGRLDVLRAVELACDPNALQRSRIEGVVGGAAPAQTTLTLNTGQQTRPDANGAYRFDGLPSGAYTVTASGPNAFAAQHAWLSGTQLSVAWLDFGAEPTPAAAPAAGAFAPVAPPTTADVAFFPATQHTLGEPFRSFWERNGGLPVFGYPLSEPFAEPAADGRSIVVQYFERHRLEAHPENAPPYNVLLARLGTTVLEQHGRDWTSFGGGVARPGCQYFAATRHSVCDAFLRQWHAAGVQLDTIPALSDAENLALFGLPLSEPQLETGSDGAIHLVQWFERARFEQHGSAIELGLLGREVLVPKP